MNNFCHHNNNNSKLLIAQAHIWNHTFNFINSMSLKCAVELGIPDIIHSHGKPIAISELNNALSIHPTKAHCIARLMRILVHSGFFALIKTDDQNDDKQEEAYALTDTSQLLLKDHPFSARPFLLAMLDLILIKPWEFLSHWFVNDYQTAFSTAHGMPFWDYLVRDPNLTGIFNKAMSSDAQLINNVLIGQGKEVFDGLNSIVDVGGGTGTVAKAIAEKFPQIECIVLDLPHVVAGLTVALNLKYVAGDMFESIPPADAVLLKWIMHDWGDDECLKILKRCKKAIEERKGGKVIIIDMVIMENENSEAIETQLFLDMLMMMVSTGKERNEKEWAQLFSDAGFKSYKIIPILGLRSIIEVYP